MPLGQKIVRSINTLGRKAEHTVNKIGQKANGVIHKVGTGIANADNIASNAINQAADFGQRVVDKSGGVTNVLRAGSNIANAIGSNLDNLGVPGGNLAHSATKSLARGAEILDKKRDKLANKIEAARNSALLEKDNLRKQLDAKKDELQNNIHSNFV